MMANESKCSGRRVTDGLPRLAGWVAGIFVACLLLSSAIAHLSNPYRFLDAIHGYRLVPRLLAELLTALLPFMHLTIAMLLIAGFARRAAFRVGFMLFLLYAVAQTATLLRGLEVGCGCFGPAKSMAPIGPRTIALAVVGLTMCLLGGWIERGGDRPRTSLGSAVRTDVSAS